MNMKNIKNMLFVLLLGVFAGCSGGVSVADIDNFIVLNQFDQGLNTSENVTFNNVTVSMGISVNGTALCQESGVNCPAGISPIWASDGDSIFLNDSFPSFVNVSSSLFVNGSSQRVGVGTSSPDGLFDTTPDTIGVESYTYNRPRMTTAQRDALTGMQLGATIFDTTIGSSYMYDGATWRGLDRLSTVFINTIDDFPAPVNGTITFDVGVKYIIGQTIVTDLEFKIPDDSAGTVHIESGVFASTAIVYTDTGVMFSAKNYSGLFKLNDMAILSPVGTTFNLSGSGTGGITSGGGAFLHLTSTGIFSSQKIGFLNRVTIAIIFGGFFDFADGLESTNSLAVLLDSCNVNFGRNAFNSTFFRVRGNISTFQVLGSQLITQSNETAFDFAPNLQILSGISVAANVFSTVGKAFADGSLNQTSPRVKMLSNTNLPDSTANLKSAFRFNTNETLITAIAVPVKINSSLWNLSISERFNHTSDGRFTYIGSEPAPILVTGIVSMRPVSGGTDVELSLFLAKNGVVLEESETIITANVNTVQSAALSDLLIMQEGDFLELYVDNQDTTTNIIVAAAHIVLKK